jgi:hypothetical protein
MPKSTTRITAAAFAALTLAAGVASAQAGTGGVNPSPPPSTQPQPPPETGSVTLHWVRSIASWYGPGLYGNRTACGQRLTRRTMGVANRKLPCGTRVAFRFHNTVVRTTVIDRGPYANGASWDLTRATADALGFTETGVGRVQVAKVSATQP